MIPEEQKQEMERCQCPLYFHNKWLTYDNKENMTRAGWEARMIWLKGDEKSCMLSCGPGDWHKGGKCDLNGCWYE